MTKEELDKTKVKEIVCKYGILFVKGAISKEQYYRILSYCRSRTNKQDSLLKEVEEVFE